MYRDFDQQTTVCFTGHRNLQAQMIPRVHVRLAEELSAAYRSGYRTFLCGGARGFDTLAAQAVLRFREEYKDARLVLVIPCADQADHWTAEERETWKRIREKSDEVRILSETYYTGCMQVRNRYMVDRSSLCLCWMTHFKGGTWSTVRYALHCGLMLKNLAMPDRPEPVMKENSWNYISIFRSVSGNVNTARLSLSRLQRKKKMHMSARCSGKRKCGEAKPLSQ